MLVKLKKDEIKAIREIHQGLYSELAQGVVGTLHVGYAFVTDKETYYLKKEWYNGTMNILLGNDEVRFENQEELEQYDK